MEATVDVYKHISFQDICKNLEKEGYSIIDNALDTKRTAAIRDELCALFKNGLMQEEPSTYLSAESAEGTTELISASHFFAFQYDEAKPPKVPLTAAIAYMRTFCATLVREVNKSIQDLELEDTIEYNKFACSTGDGAFLPKHMDNDGSNPYDFRKLTCILYLNPNWQEADGGKLRIHLIAGNTTHRDIEPIDNRIVVFFSDIMVHEVLPVYTKDTRFTLTVWIPCKFRSKIHEDKELYTRLIYQHFSEYLY